MAGWHEEGALTVAALGSHQQGQWRYRFTSHGRALHEVR